MEHVPSDASLHALQATNKRLSAAIELTLQLSSELDVRRLLQGVGHGAREIVGARYSMVGILDGDGSRFQPLFTSGMSAAEAAHLGALDPKAAVLQAILQQGRCVRLHSRGGDPVGLGFSKSHPLTYSWLGAPIASANRIYGYLGLINKIGLDEFTEEDERLARILAAQVGRIYQNGKVYSELLSHAADLERPSAAEPGGETDVKQRGTSANES